MLFYQKSTIVFFIKLTIENVVKLYYSILIYYGLEIYYSYLKE